MSPYQKITCQQCGKTIFHYANKAVEFRVCPKCGEKIYVPEEDSPSSES